jgi:phosphopantothenoylcysteine decarboxylase/phosphopantothenate--cysteine ligase
MHPVMWGKPSVQGHVATLRARGVGFVGPVQGPLASGETGWGRMAEPAEIVAAIGGEDLARRARWARRTVLVTAGPTQEPLDPVRFLGNRSSGRMGFALAAAAQRRGARALLVAGPVSLATPVGVERHDVTTAREMQAAVERFAPQADLVVMTAAVADFRVASPAASKIKRGEGKRTVDLLPNPDILAALADLAPRAVRVGFAAETEQLARNAEAKLAAKRCHFVVGNDVSRPDIGFDSAHNEVTVWRAGADPVFLPRRDKEALAGDLLDLFEAALETREAGGAAAPAGAHFHASD